MQRRAIISSSFVLVAAGGWWVLHRERGPVPESTASAPADAGLEQSATVPPDEPPRWIELEPPTGAFPSTSSRLLDRHRDRLRDTAARLTARRDQARASGAPKPTVQALDAHLSRVEQRLAELEVSSATGITAAATSPKAASTEPGS